MVFDRHGVDLSVHGSMVDAVRAVEPTDVKYDEYVVFDSEGRLLTLSVETEGGRERVTLVPSEAVPSHSEEFRRRLVGYLTATGDDASTLDKSSLANLISSAHKRERGRR